MKIYVVVGGYLSPSGQLNAEGVLCAGIDEVE